MLPWEWKTVWLLWVCMGLGLAAAGLILSPADTHTPNHWEHGLAEKRAELAFCIIQNAQGSCLGSCQPEERKRPVCWQVSSTMCTEAQSLGNLGPAQGNKWGLFYPRTGH